MTPDEAEIWENEFIAMETARMDAELDEILEEGS